MSKKSPQEATEAWNGINRALGDFLNAQEAIFDLARFTQTEVVALDNTKALAREFTRNALSDDVPDETRTRVYESASHFWDTLNRLENPETGATALGSANEVNAAFATLAATIEDTGVDALVIFSYVSRFSENQRRIHRAPMMLESLHISTVSNFESFVARLARASLKFDPAPLKSSGTTYTWVDIAGFSSIEEMQEACIDRYVDSLMREDLDSWMKFLARASRLDESLMSEVLDEIAEPIQRRHVLVHNGGLASGLYLKKVGRRAVGIVVGDKLPVLPEYLESCMEHLTLIAIVVAQASLRAVVSTQDDWASPDGGFSPPPERIFELLQQGRNICPALAFRHLSPYVEEASQLENLRVNAWIARKRLRGLSSIREEVEKWDTSALTGRYRAAKACLLDKVQEVEAMIPSLIQVGEISEMSVATWPIFEPVRNVRASTSARSAPVISSAVDRDEKSTPSE